MSLSTASVSHWCGVLYMKAQPSNYFGKFGYLLTSIRAQQHRAPAPSNSAACSVLVHHLVARWQETDYRDFRINFIQFMRTPPAAVAASGDGPELVPVEIVAESESTPVKKTQQEATHETNIVQQPVVVDVAAYEGAGATEKVRVWPVPEEEAAEGDETSPANTVNEQALSAATAAAVVVAAAVVPKKSAPLSGVSDTDTSPPSPPSEPEGPARSDGGDSDELVEAAAAPCLLLSSKAQTAHPEPARAHEETETTSGSAAAAAGEAVPDGSWTNEERTRRTPSCSEPDKSGGGDGGPCSLGWSSPDEGNEADEEEEEDDADNGIRTRRSFSNLETARRGGAGLTNAIVADDSSDGDDSCDGSADDGGEGHRPRALSLDGWFTCGLENGVNAKSYETHDHAGRLRDLVKLVSYTHHNAYSTLAIELALNLIVKIEHSDLCVRLERNASSTGITR